MADKTIDIRPLENNEGSSYIYPLTSTTAVKDLKTNETLDKILEDLAKTDLSNLSADAKDYLLESIKESVVTVSENGKIPSDLIGDLPYIPTSDKGIANGIATLDNTGKLTIEQMPALDTNGITNAQVGAANGVAPLDSDKKVPVENIPDLDYIPTSEKNAANGVPTLDTNSKVTASQTSAGIIYNSASTVAVNSGTYAGKMIICTALSTTVTISASSSLPVGTEFEVCNYGGSVTFKAGSGVTIKSADDALTLSTLFTCACLKCIYENTWLLCGTLE